MLRGLSIVIAFAMALAVSDARAADLGGDVTRFATVFNAKTKALGVSVKAARGSCTTDVRQACTYTIAEGLNVIAGSAADKKTLETLQVHFMSQDNMAALDYIATLGTIMMLYAPDADKDERGVVLRTMTSQLTSGQGGETDLHGLAFNMTIIKPFGLLTSVKRK